MRACSYHSGDGEFGCMFGDDKQLYVTESGTYCLAHLPIKDKLALFSEEDIREFIGSLEESISSGVQYFSLEGIQVPGELHIRPGEGYTKLDFRNAVFGGIVFFESEGQTFQGELDCSGACFESFARFKGVECVGQISFANATFKDYANFKKFRYRFATIHKGKFETRIDFEGAIFEERAYFQGSVFESDANFRNCIFKGDTSFEKAVFQGEVNFIDSRYAKGGNFSNARFEKLTNFSLAKFSSLPGFFEEPETFILGEDTLEPEQGTITKFNQCYFKGHAVFQSIIADACLFEDAVFDGATQFIGLSANYLKFDLATFNGMTLLDDIAVSGFCLFVHTKFNVKPNSFRIRGNFLSLKRTRFEKGGVLYIQHARVDMEGTLMEGPTSVLGWSQKERKPGSASIVLDHTINHEIEGLDSYTFNWQPSITSVTSVDLKNTVFSDVRLDECRFLGSFNLDKLRIDGTCKFKHTPTGWKFGSVFPFIWHWTYRRTILEEHLWRARTRKWQGWYSQALEPKGVSKTAKKLTIVYRNLRKGREDQKNEPGAADFYYGEMEMRRRGSSSLSEKTLLWLYWAISGYGLRPLRSFSMLLVVVTCAAFVLWHGGFTQSVAYSDAWQFSAGATVGLKLSDDLNSTGKWVHISLRILGPALYALTALAIRGRIKR